MYTAIDHEGKLAVASLWSSNWTEPFDERILWVSNIDADQYPALIDVSTDDVSGNTLLFHIPDLKPHRVNVSNWERIVLRKSVKKPRRGKNYDWVWQSGRWEKRWER